MIPSERDPLQDDAGPGDFIRPGIALAFAASPEE
jgi:hypothetical protein